METSKMESIQHPGFYLREEMEKRGWLQRDLAFILGCRIPALNTIVSGRRSVSPDMAKALAVAFDVPAEFFANLQQAYDLAKAGDPDPGIAIRAKLQNQYPVREMIRRGWIEQSPPDALGSQMANFFQVPNINDIPYMPEAAKATRYEAMKVPAAQLAWLFRVRRLARSMRSPGYSEDRLRESLPALEQLLTAPEKVAQVPAILMECGIRFVLVEKLPQTSIDGVCFWIGKSPVIGMSLRRDRIDTFWFILRHEIEHVLRGHGREIEMIDTDMYPFPMSAAVSEEEQAANEAAAGFCVPQDSLSAFLLQQRHFIKELDVLVFARQLNRHPGLVVGQMQRRMNDFSYLSKYLLKVREFILPAAHVDGWGRVATTG
jgi:HTH-type transcriptional regulator/antitoxin HigA